MTPPPPFLYHGAGMTLRVRPRVNIFFVYFTRTVLVQLLFESIFAICLFNHLLTTSMAQVPILRTRISNKCRKKGRLGCLNSDF